MKMYILVKKSVPKGLGINSVGHAALMAYLKFQDHPDTKDWLKNSFRKVTCRVSDEEFEEAKKIKDVAIVTESDYNDEEVALAFRPRIEWPKMFEKLRLFR